MNNYEGNSMAWMAEQDLENTASHQDQYLCTCGLMVPTGMWNKGKKCCVYCAEEGL